MELLLFIFVIYLVPIYCLWLWGKRKDELTKVIDKMEAEYTATASIIAPEFGREGDCDLESCRKVITSVLNGVYNIDTTNRLSEIILERAFSREDYVTFSRIVFEGVIAQIEYEQDSPITPRQRKKISSIMFRKRNIDEMIWQ